MGAITGREIVFGIKKATTWRTAVACEANDGVLVLSQSLGPYAPVYFPDKSLGQANVKEYYKVSERIAGTFQGLLRYYGLEPVIAMVMGTAGTPAQQGATAAYLHTFQIADSIDAIFASFATKKKSDKVWEMPSAKPHGLTIEGGVGDPLKVTLSVLGNKYNINGASGTNNTTTIANVTYPTSKRVVMFDANTKFRINDQDGAALADTDKVYPHSFTLEFTRPMDELYDAEYQDMTEPVQNEFAEPTLTLRFNRYNLDTFMDAIAADTEKKLDIYFKGDLISGAYYYDFMVECPNVKVISGVADAGGPGNIPHEVTLQLMACDSAPTGMTGITKPFQIKLISIRSTDALA